MPIRDSLPSGKWSPSEHPMSVSEAAKRSLLPLADDQELGHEQEDLNLPPITVLDEVPDRVEYPTKVALR